MPRINLIGASNHLTNNTCQFGSMAGLAPTTNVRPNVTSLPGYKYSITLNDVNNLSKGCGSNKGCDNGRKCLKALGLYKGVNVRYDTVRGKLLG